MATNDLSTKAKICDAALALLRQDVGYSGSASMAKKCDAVWNLAVESLKGAHKWASADYSQWTAAAGDSPALPSNNAMRQLLVYALAAELSIPVTGRQEDKKTIDAMYAARLRDAKVRDLEEAMRTVNDDSAGVKLTKEVIKRLHPYFATKERAERGDPVGYAYMAERVESAKETVFDAVKNAHDWSIWGTDYVAEIGNMYESDLLRPVLVSALVAAVAPAAGVPAEQVQQLELKAKEALALAVSKDLEDETVALREKTDADSVFAVQVLDTLRQYYSVSEADARKPQPRSIAHLVQHIGVVKERVRQEVLLSHDWSFATDEREVFSRKRIDGRWETPIPGDVAKVVKCYSDVCEKAEAFIRNGDTIVTREPVRRIVFLFDDGGTDSWTELAKRAYLYRVVQTVALASPELVGNPARIQQLTQVVDDAVQAARTEDSRQTHLGTSAYGRNYLYDVATGRRKAKWMGLGGLRGRRC